jgi:hypothetical protein
VGSDRLARSPQVVLRVARTQFGRLLDRQAGRDVAVERIVRGRLVGHEVEALPAPGELGHDFSRIAEQSDRQRPTGLRSFAHARERLFQRVGRLVQVTGLAPAPDPLRVDLHAQDRRAGHRRCERLRAAHPAQTGSEDRPAAEIR